MTTYTPTPNQFIATPQTAALPMQLTAAEEHLILRLRMEKRKGSFGGTVFIVDPFKMTMQPIHTGEIEELSKP